MFSVSTSFVLILPLADSIQVHVLKYVAFEVLHDTFWIIIDSFSYRG